MPFPQISFIRAQGYEVPAFPRDLEESMWNWPPILCKTRWYLENRVSTQSSSLQMDSTVRLAVKSQGIRVRRDPVFSKGRWDGFPKIKVVGWTKIRTGGLYTTRAKHLCLHCYFCLVLRATHLVSEFLCKETFVRTDTVAMALLSVWGQLALGSSL